MNTPHDASAGARGSAAIESSMLGVLRLLDASPSRTQREMAHELGMSLGKANYLLRALLNKGFVKVRNFRNSANKRAYAYLLTPAGAAAKADLTRRFLARKMQEYDALRLEIDRLLFESGHLPDDAQAGRRSRARNASDSDAHAHVTRGR